MPRRMEAVVRLHFRLHHIERNDDGAAHKAGNGPGDCRQQNVLVVRWCNEDARLIGHLVLHFGKDWQLLQRPHQQHIRVHVHAVGQDIASDGKRKAAPHEHVAVPIDQVAHVAADAGGLGWTVVWERKPRRLMVTN